MGPKKVLQTRSELASRWSASDGQKSKVGFSVIKETGAQGVSRRAEMVSDRSNGAQKSSADSQGAGQSIERVRWPKIEGRIFRDTGNWGLGRFPEGRNGI